MFNTVTAVQECDPDTLHYRDRLQLKLPKGMLMITQIFAFYLTAIPYEIYFQCFGTI